VPSSVIHGSAQEAPPRVVFSSSDVFPYRDGRCTPGNHGAPASLPSSVVGQIDVHLHMQSRQLLCLSDGGGRGRRRIGRGGQGVAFVPH